MGAVLIRNIFREKINNQLLLNISVLMQTFFLVIFSMIFLNLSLYSHQIFSLILIIICTTIFLIETIFYTKDINIIEIVISFLYFSSYELLYCLSDVIGKKYLNTYLDGVYKFLFKVGITGLIPLLIYDIIGYFFHLGNYHGIIQTIFFSDMAIWFFLCNILFCTIFELSIWLIIYNFSPCHFIILEALGDCLYIITSIIDKDNDKLMYFVKEQIITFCILYPVLTFAVLVFNEILILNFLGLNYNTKLYISIRERTDSLGEINPNNENDEENEDFEENEEQIISKKNNEDNFY